MTFGIDYDHQSVSTTTIPTVMSAALEKELRAATGDAFRSVAVEFALAGASSLDYVVLAAFEGSVGDKYQGLERRIQRILVDTCNEHGWVIPFSQLTVHTA